MIIRSQNFFSNKYFYDLLEIKKNEIVKWACRKLIKFCEAGFYCGWFRYDRYTIIPIKGISDPLNYQFLFDHINPIQNGKIYVRGGLDHKKNDAVPSGTLDFQASQRSIQSVDR